MRIPCDAESLSGYISDVCKEGKQDDKAFIKVKSKIVADIIHFVKREKMSFIDTRRAFKPHMSLLLSRLIASGVVTFDDLRPLSHYLSCSPFLYHLPNLTTSEAEEIGSNASKRLSDAISNSKSADDLIGYLYDDFATFTDFLGHNYTNNNLLIEREKFNLVLKSIDDLLDEYIDSPKAVWNKKVRQMTSLDRPEITLFLQKGFFNERFKETVIEMINSPIESVRNIILENLYAGGWQNGLFRLLPSWDKKDTDRIWDVAMNYCYTSSGIGTRITLCQCDVINSLPVDSISLEKIEALEKHLCNVAYAKKLLESRYFGRVDDPKLLLFVETMVNMSEEVAYAVMSSPCRELSPRILINAAHTINQSVIAGNPLNYRSMRIFTLPHGANVKRFFDVMDMCADDQRFACYDEFVEGAFNEFKNLSLKKSPSDIYYDGYYTGTIYGLKRLVESMRKGRIDAPYSLYSLSPQNFDKLVNYADQFDWSFFDKFLN